MNAPAQAAGPPKAPTFAMLRTLAGIATLSGVLVVLVFKFTAPMIEKNQREAIERAIFQVVPGAVSRVDFVVQGDDLKLAEPGDEGEMVYAAYDKGGLFKGMALQAAQQGYQDVIKMLFGYDPTCQCITGIKILKMTETPGLGDKIAFDPAFLTNFEALDTSLNAIGDGLANPIVAVKHGAKTKAWQIDSISGATVSSVAVAKGLNKSAHRLAPVLMRHLDLLKTEGSKRALAQAAAAAKAAEAAMAED